jgi:hypothetical protein
MFHRLAIFGTRDVSHAHIDIRVYLGDDCFSSKEEEPFRYHSKLRMDSHCLILITALHLLPFKKLNATCGYSDCRVVPREFLGTVIMSALGSFFAITVALTLIVCHDDARSVWLGTQKWTHIGGLYQCACTRHAH